MDGPIITLTLKAQKIRCPRQYTHVMAKLANYGLANFTIVSWRKRRNCHELVVRRCMTEMG